MAAKTTHNPVRRLFLRIIMDPRAIIALFVFIFVYLLKNWTSLAPDNDDELRNVPRFAPDDDIDADLYPLSRFYHNITRTWDDRPLTHKPVQVYLMPHNDAGVKVIVNAPFFDDPKNPGGKAGETFPGLWDYEVVEVFFLNDKEQYVEVELSPHGQHLVLLLEGARKSFKDGLPLEYTSEIFREDGSWQGEVVIPAVYFPPEVTKVNMYAIHGSGDERVYEALYPAPTGEHDEPNFHRLEYFKKLDFQQLLPSNSKERYSSSLWERS